MTENKLEQSTADELQSRVRDFNGELIPLLKKYKLGLGASAYLTQDGRIAAKPSLLDDSQAENVTDDTKDDGSSEVVPA